MLLKHQYNGNLGGGGGNRLGPATITFGGISGHVAPLAGEMMVFTIEAQYGVFGVQNQPTWSVSDDAGNVWVNVGDTFLDGIIVGFGDPTGAYLGAFDLSTWVCFAHNGSTLTTLTFTQTNVMTNGWDCQGGATLSIWDTSGYTATYYSNTFSNTVLTSPALDPFNPPAGTELIIASFSAGSSPGIEGGTYQPGWTGPLTTGIGLYVDDYKLAPTGIQTPTYTSPNPGSYWLASAVAITSVPPTITASIIPSTVPSGSSATLTWSSTNATSMTINNGIGTVATSGSLSISGINSGFVLSATTSAAFPNRIQLLLGDTVVEPYTLTATGAGGTTQTTVDLNINVVGPFAQNGPLGQFDPRRDLQVYVDGSLIPIATFSYDVGNERYLLYTEQQFNVQGVIQVVHHVPSPPFMSGPVAIPGFVILAEFAASNLQGWGSGWGEGWGTGN